MNSSAFCMRGISVSGRVWIPGAGVTQVTQKNDNARARAIIKIRSGCSLRVFSKGGDAYRQMQEGSARGRGSRRGYRSEKCIALAVIRWKNGAFSLSFR